MDAKEIFGAQVGILSKMGCQTRSDSLITTSHALSRVAVLAIKADNSRRIVREFTGDDDTVETHIEEPRFFL